MTNHLVTTSLYSEIPSETVCEIPWHMSCWFTKWQFVVCFYMHSCVQCFLLLKEALKVSGRDVGSSAVNPSLWDCTEGWEQRKGKDGSSCDPSLSLYLLPNILHFGGGRRWTETCQACNKYTVLHCYFLNSPFDFY